MTGSLEDIKNAIRTVPDFPKKGILFYDITTVLKDPVLFKSIIDLFVKPFQDKGIKKVIAIEARGFIFGSAVAYTLGCGFIPVRKKGKLPAPATAVSYALEYGTDTLEMHNDAVSPGEKVLIVDDVIATGGTMASVAQMVQDKGADIVSIRFFLELDFLHGREKLKQFPVFDSLIHF